jgi:predicted Zn-dependent protease
MAGRTLGAAHSETGILVGLLGDILLAQHRPAEAESALRKLVTGRPKSAPDDWHLAIVKSRWGRALLELGHYAEAEPLLTEGYARLREETEKIPRWNKAEVTLARDQLAQLYALWGKPAPAGAGPVR